MKTQLLFFALTMALLSASFAPAREWMDSTGAYRVEAELIDFKDGKVRLKKENGKIITVPIEKLSEADQLFVKKQFAKRPLENPGGAVKKGAVASQVGVTKHHKGKTVLLVDCPWKEHARPSVQIRLILDDKVDVASLSPLGFDVNEILDFSKEMWVTVAYSKGIARTDEGVISQGGFSKIATLDVAGEHYKAGVIPPDLPKTTKSYWRVSNLRWEDRLTGTKLSAWRYQSGPSPLYDFSLASTLVNGTEVFLATTGNSLGRYTRWAFAPEKKTTEIGPMIVFCGLESWAGGKGVLHLDLPCSCFAPEFSKRGRIAVWLLSGKRTVWSNTVAWPGKHIDGIPKTPGERPREEKTTPSVPKITRKWTDSTGKKRIFGTFVDFTNGEVRIKKVGGEIVPILIEKLSNRDQAFVKGAREWTDNAGETSIFGTFVDVEDAKVRVKRIDGETAVIPIERLSKTDQEFARFEPFRRKSTDELMTYIQSALHSRMSGTGRVPWLVGGHVYRHAPGSAGDNGEEAVAALIDKSCDVQPEGELKDALDVLRRKLGGETEKKGKRLGRSR